MKTISKVYPDCVSFEGRDGHYQSKALDAWYAEFNQVPASWSWVTVTCATRNCLNPYHLELKSPLKLAYPYGVCIYCGRTAGTKDHLLPRYWSGASKRAYVVTVPACGTCNSLLSDTLTWSITERRAICHIRFRRHFRKVLRTVEYGPSDLAEFGDSLRAFVVDGMNQKAEVLRCLEWPGDPGYDARACAKSGIPDAYEIGLLLDEKTALQIAVDVTSNERRQAA